MTAAARPRNRRVFSGHGYGFECLEIDSSDSFGGVDDVKAQVT